MRCYYLQRRIFHLTHLVRPRLPLRQSSALVRLTALLRRPETIRTLHMSCCQVPRLFTHQVTAFHHQHRARWSARRCCGMKYPPRSQGLYQRFQRVLDVHLHRIRPLKLHVPHPSPRSQMCQLSTRALSLRRQPAQMYRQSRCLLFLWW